MHVCVVCAKMNVRAYKMQKVSDPQSWTVVIHLILVLGTKFWPSSRAVCGLKHGTISPFL